MIDKSNFKYVLVKLGFIKTGDVYHKNFPDIDAYLKVDFKNKTLHYPLDKGFKVNGDFTSSFNQNENFVVFECINRLFEKGYKPQHIELEPTWTVGHGASGGRADVMVKDNTEKSLMIIECKTAGKEFEKEWRTTLINGGQMFSYAKQAGSTQFIALYTSDFVDNDVSEHYFLITLKDNHRLLNELSDKKPLSYEKAKLLDKEDIHQAWKETYELDYATKGIFESDIPAYEIGKTNYSLDDLTTISSNDIQGKYHQFATILRQHNVSGRENAFDKLVNLFLCKIVDETNNPDDLRFYWKGIANDSYFDLQDRLQKLYQEGMSRFLGEDVTYIDNEAIDQAFRFFKNDPDATKDTIKKYFRELKFFTNNDFAFIDVHNERLFYQNANVLLKLVHLFQDIHLKTEDGNQFLGDMFESFLDQGVKQSEGQFFTPMPIVKFILKSLPIKQLITQSEQIPKVIDYACGAGHFINEYAQEAKKIIKLEKETDISKYYENTTGIEKEYRLSKVAKVSSFMYGQDDINIVYADALATNKTIKDNEYSLLVANPPYSVKGFLETLSESDRNKYELINAIDGKSYPNNNSIETFFIERAKQLLKSGGVAAIIVPVSVLTKGKAKSTSQSTNIYVATREILLKYFDIVAIAELGKGTFGKTGTATVTLFLRRKNENPAPAVHYQNRVNSWFNNDKTKEGVFSDEQLIKRYCAHLELKFEDYQSLLEGNPSEELLKTEVFTDYQKEFSKWKKTTDYKKSPVFKKLSKENQKKELFKRFLNYLQSSEKDKLYYFVLASINPQKVLIVKSPSKITEMKEFLGYDWSNAKGKEGINYLGTSDSTIETEANEDGDVTIDEEDKRVLNNMFNLNNIKTNLYDPKDDNNVNKINHLIAHNFNNTVFTIPEDLKPFVSISPLTDMLDFGNINFNKKISLTPKTTYKFVTKWGQEKLGKLVFLNPSRAEIKGFDKKKLVSFVEMASVSNEGYIQQSVDKKYGELQEGSYTYFKENDIIIAKITPCMENGKCAIAKDLTNGIGLGSTEFHVLRCGEKVLNKYIFEILNREPLRVVAEQNMTGSSGHRRVPDDFYKSLSIPLPPIDIQKQIANSCDKLDEAYKKSQMTIRKEKEKIQKLFSDLFMNANRAFKLSDNDVFDLSIGKRVLKAEINHKGLGNPVFSANVFKPFGHINKQLLTDFSVPSVLWGIDGDWMVNFLPLGIPFYPTDHCGVLRLKGNEIHPRYLAWVLEKEGQKVRFSRDNRASLDSMRGLTIMAPTYESQLEMISEVEKCEKRMKQPQKLISEINTEKEKVIQKYL